MVGLGPGELEMLGIGHEHGEGLRVVPDDVGKGLRLPGADVDLAQAPIEQDRQIPSPGEGLGGEARPVEVAGIDRVEVEVPEARGETLPLLMPERGDVAVPLPLHEAIEVPLRLDVANDINFCHNWASWCLTAAAGYSIIGNM